MKTLTAAAALILLGLASPVLADDQGNANAEQQTQPTPSRGNTSGGPAHDLNTSGRDAARPGRSSDDARGRAPASTGTAAPAR
ncbi:MAG: hypothetical protein K2Y56_18440 [Methylobacterium sp.]|uniref:hypothetical protein n=1 Tax=Methylobacterium sp. TaxID=409 RepID=UPI0025F1970D|nr:hypothetical protein [Methylobacterium sp.]MBX9933476.1 hypothetical protein [Methylobacterium sp.]